MQNNISLLLAISKADAVMARRLSGHGLSFNDYAILYHLSNAPQQKLRRIDLAHKLGLTASGITRMLLPLEKLHIVARDQNEEDARARYATLTEAGKELFRDATATVEMKLEEFIPANSQGQVEAFIAFTNKMIESMLQGEYQQEAKVRWGNTQAYKQSADRIKKMSKQDLEKIKADGIKLAQQIADTMKLGAENPKTQELIAKHYESLRNFYEPNLEIYQGLGQMYVDDPRFSDYYEKIKPGLAVFMRNAIKIFCERNK